MKKLIISAALIIALSSVAFAKGFFSHRYFELRTDVTAAISNNVFSPLDYFVENPVIDFTKIADSMNDRDFVLATKVQPVLSLALDIPNGLNFGIDIGLDTKGSLGLSNSVFEFLGKGHDFTKEEDFTISIPNSYVDVFAYVQATGGWNFSNFSILLQPAVFSTIAHAGVDQSSITVKNTNNAEFGYELNGVADIYTPFNLSAFMNSDDMKGYTKGIFSGSFADNEIWKSAGFDMGASVKMNLGNYWTVGVNTRFPIVPSHVNHKMSYSVKSAYTTSVTQITSTAKVKGSEDPNDPDTPLPEFTTYAGEDEDTYYFINRPLKLGVDFNFHPFGALLKNYGSIGIAFEHPFADNKAERDFYVDYLLGARFSLWDVLSFNFSTERTDKVYIHKAVLGLNFRLFEFDAGVASESTNLATSFRLDGLGVFITACVGF